MILMGIRGRIKTHRSFPGTHEVLCITLLLLMIIGCTVSFRISPFLSKKELSFYSNHKLSPSTCISPATTIHPRYNYNDKKCCMARYGPKEEDNNRNDGSRADDSSSTDTVLLLQQLQQQKLRELVKEIIDAKPPQLLPSIVTMYLDILLSMKGNDGIRALNTIVDEASAEQKEEVSVACDYILDFMEAFVEEAQSMDDTNKRLLGKIVRAIAPSTDNGSTAADARNREEELDAVLEEEKDNFTPGFLRHVENECWRLSNSPTISKDATRLLETLQIIHLRIMEELGKNLGENAIVLGQLIGYDDKAERIAVLEGGLTVRGVEFARELSALTKEALEGFKEAAAAANGDGVDAELVERVKEIDDRLNGFLDWNP